MEPGFFTIVGKRLQVETVVAVYNISALEETLPFSRFVITVSQRGVADYLASPNAAVRNATSGDVEYTCGLGRTIDEAVEDAIKQFFSEVEKQSKVRILAGEDFVWVTDWPVGTGIGFDLPTVYPGGVSRHAGLRNGQ